MELVPRLPRYNKETNNEDLDIFEEELDIILTISGAAVVAVLGFLNVVEPEVVSAAILTILSLIAISLLVNRATDSQLQQTTERILERLYKPSIDQVLIPHRRCVEEIEQRLLLAQEVWILSRTCTHLWQDYNDQFMRLLSDGRGNVRLMLVDPNDGAVKMIVRAAEGFERSTNVDLRRANIEDLLTRLARLRSQIGEKSLQVRTIDYLPAWTLLLIDPLSGAGVVYVELATFRSNPRNRPTFSLIADKDKKLFEQFRTEFETMWNRAHPTDTTVYAGGNDQ